MRIDKRLAQSRDRWKKKAVKRGTKMREMAKAIKRIARRNEKREQALKKRISELEAELEAIKSTSAVQATKGPQCQDDVRTLCLLMVLIGVIPFRAVPRCLAICHPTTAWIPHFTSVINWAFRLGLAKMQSVKAINQPWIAIVDMSIDVAVQKALVVLRLPLQALAERGSAVTLEDCEVVGLEVDSTWDGERVAEALARTFAVAGQPLAILKDGGTDLARGVRLYSSEKARRIPTLDDIGHVAANALKAMYKEHKGFKKFLSEITPCARAMRQTVIACLTPPKIRTKGRFMSISKLAQWAEKIMPLRGGPGRVEEGTVAHYVRRYLSGIGRHQAFIKSFSKHCLVCRDFIQIAKNQGINRASYQKMKRHLNRLEEGSYLRVTLEQWLSKHMRIHCMLSIEQTPLAVSSDIIESLLGKFKVVLARNPKAEFAKNILLIPTLCGKTPEREDLIKALAQVSHSDLLKWSEVNIKNSGWQMRMAFNKGKLLPKSEPKTGKAA